MKNIIQYLSAYNHPGDEELVALSGIRPGDFEEIYHRYYPLLLNIARKKLNSRAVAEDLVQEVFVSLYQRREYVEFKVSVNSYLSRAIRFKIFNEYRAENVRLKYSKNDFSSPVCKNDFSSIEMKELAQKIENLYNRLPERCREVFFLSRNGGFSRKDISDKLQISISTVEKHISKALKIFREGLCEYTSVAHAFNED
ncbi:RNA polymerase sigma-70 factor [Flavitalea flava]